MQLNYLDEYGVKKYYQFYTIPLKKLAFLVIILISLGGLARLFFQGPTISVVINTLIEFSIAVLFLKNLRKFSLIEIKHKKLLQCFFAYGLLVVAHSLFIAKSYDQWRYLVTVFLPTLLLPFFSLIVVRPENAAVVFNKLMTITAPLSFSFVALGAFGDKNKDLIYLNYASIVYLLVIFLPHLKFRKMLMIVAICFFSFTYDMNNRANMLGIISSFGLMLFYMISIKFSASIFIERILKFARHFIFALPIVLLVFGYLGVFNVFSYVGELGAVKEINLSANSGRLLTTDSRTGIYVDALENLNNRDDWLFGSSAVVVYKTHLAETDSDWNTGRLGGSESGFLGLLTFGGLIYVMLFTLLCFRASYLALYKSNNNFIKIVGLFVVFRWFVTFIESPLSFNFTWIILFIALGMALSSEFRLMTEKNISDYIRKL